MSRRQPARNRTASIATLALVSAVGACGGSGMTSGVDASVDQDRASGSGGDSASGGANGSGGATSSGGTVGSGGATGSGGGVTSSGGANASGGATASGGSGGAGGSPPAGGAAGRASPVGGAGGKPATGGAMGAGGAASAGGAQGLGSWATLAPMPLGARQEIGVTAFQGQVYVIGGMTGSSIAHRVESYDPKTNKWTTRAMLPFAVDHPNLAATDDKLYILGATGTTSSTAYDPTTDTWSTKKSLPTQRAAGVALTIGTKIYVIGGAMGDNGASFGATVRDFAVYDTVGDSWETLDPMPAPGRNHFAGAVVNGIIYIMGGRTGGPTDGLQDRVDAYDPASKTWTQKMKMPRARGGLAGGLVNGHIIVTGGEGNDPLINPKRVFPETDSYDPVTDTWTTLASMKTPRHGMGAAAIDGKLYVPGGATAQGGSGPTDILEAFTP